MERRDRDRENFQRDRQEPDDLKACRGLGIPPGWYVAIESSY